MWLVLPLSHSHLRKYASPDGLRQDFPGGNDPPDIVGQPVLFWYCFHMQRSVAGLY